MNETRGKIDLFRYFLKRRDSFERILNAASTSDCTRIDKAPVSSASRRSVSSDVSPPFFPRASLYPGYVLFMDLDRSPQNETDSFFRRERTASSSRGNLFDTLYANSAPIACSNSARNGASQPATISSPLSSRNNFFDYVTPMRPSPPFSINLLSRFYSLAESRENSTELRRDEHRFRIPFGISFEPMRGETPAES